MAQGTAAGKPRGTKDDPVRNKAIEERIESLLMDIVEELKRIRETLERSE